MQKALISILIAVFAAFLMGCQIGDSANRPQTTAIDYLINSPYYSELVWQAGGGKGDTVIITAASQDQNIPIIYNTKTHELKAVPLKMSGSISPNGQWLAGVLDDADTHIVAVNLNDFSVISCLNLEDYYDVNLIEGIREWIEWLWSEDSKQLFIIIDNDLWQYDFSQNQSILIRQNSDDFLRAANNDDWVFENYPGGRNSGFGQSSLFRYNPQTQQKVVLLKTVEAEQKIEMKDYKNGYIVATRGPLNEVAASDILLFTPQNEEKSLGKGYFPLFRKDTDNVCYISEDLNSLVSYNISTSEEQTLIIFPKPLRAAHPYYWIDTNSVVVLDAPPLILEIE